MDDKNTMYEFEKWLSEEIDAISHAENMGDIFSGARELENALAKYRAFKAKDKAVEPLAVLAERKGCWLNVNHHNNIWRVYGSVSDGLTVKVSEWSFEAPTYAAAEAKARQFLEGLDDVREGK